MSHKLRRHLVPLFIALVLAPAVWSQDVPAAPETTKLPRNTPRELFESFLIASWNVESDTALKLSQALDCLDVSATSGEDSGTEGLKKVQHLATVLDEFPRFDLKNIPDSSGSPIFQYSIPELEGKRLVARRGSGFDDSWEFDADTVSALEDLATAVTAARTAKQKDKGDDGLDEIPAARRSPRATMATFLTADREDRTADAAACLDLSHLQATIIEEEGAALAANLRFTISRMDKVVYQTIPRDPNTKSPYVWRSTDKYAISMNRIAEGDDKGQWKFSTKTVDTIGDLAETLADAAPKPSLGVAAGEEVAMPWGIRVRRVIPEGLKGTRFFIEDWQWIPLLGLILLGVIGETLVAIVLGLIVKLYYENVSRTPMEPRLRRQFVRPLGWLAMALLWWIGLRLLDLERDALALLLGAVKFFAAVAGVWSCYRLVDLIAGMLESRASRTSSKYDDLLVPLVRKSLKIFVTVFGLVFIADTMDWKIHTLLTGLGIGGLAVAFAARETLSNILGSLTVLLDRPFHIGDWVKIGDSEGSVEAVGFRSTRIRTFYNSLITIPNSDCVNHAIDNFGARTYRRYSCHVSVAYGTSPGQLEAFCEGIRELIRRHPYTRKDYYHVYVHNFAASSIDILLYCFWYAPDWGTELRERHRLLIDIKRLAESLTVEFAFPTQTLHVHQEGPPEPEPDLGTDPRAAGIRDARSLLKDTIGLDGKIPPPVSFAIRPVVGGKDDAGS